MNVIAHGGRFRLFYLLIFAGLGIFLPFFSVWCREMGLSVLEISLLSLSIPAVKILTPSLYGVLADYHFGRTTMLRVFAIGTIFVWPLLYLATSFWPLLGVFILYALFRGPVIPFTNAAALAWLQKPEGTDDSFGRIRLFGSIGFIGAAVFGGFWADSHGTAAVIDILGIILIVTAFFSFAIDGGDTQPEDRARQGDFSTLLHQPLVLYLLAGIFLIRMAEGGYNIFYSLYIVDLGYSKTAAGLLWAAAVVSEVLVLYLAGPRLRNISLIPWLRITAALNVLRWLLLASFTGLPVLIAAQLLHGFTFGLFYVLSLEALDRNTSHRLRSTVQGIYDTIAFGAAGIAGQLLAGWSWQTGAGQQMFLASCLVAGSGFLLFALTPASMRKALGQPISLSQPKIPDELI